MRPPKLRFGTDYYALEMGLYAETVRAAEDIGLDLIGHGDSQSLWHDPYVALTVAALNSRSLRLGPMVTNPVTRHPAVTAAALLGLQELSGGRAIVGVGGGDSSVLNLGLAPARIAEVQEYAKALQDLTAGRQAIYQGRPIRLRWAPAGGAPVPVFLAAEGPRKLALAGAIADGVIVSNGISEEVVRSTVQTVRRAAVAAGRSPDAVEIWWLVSFQFAPSVPEGIDTLRWLLAANADHVFRFTLEGKHVPPELADGLRGLMSEYAHEEHAVAHGSELNAGLVDKYGLREWLGRRFAITGTPEACRDRIREVAGYGATNLIFTQLVPDQVGFVRQLGTDVLAHLR